MQAFSNLHVDTTPYPGCMLTSIYCVTINYIFEEIIIVVEVKSTKTANFIVLENFPLYSILANTHTISINTMCEIEYLGNYLLFINNEVKTDAPLATVITDTCIFLVHI